MPNDQTFPVDDQDTDVMVTVAMENGESVPCEILTIFEAAGRDYIALLPVNDAGEPNAEGIVYLYRYAEDDVGTPSIDNIQDDTEYAAVEEAFNALVESASTEA